MVNNNLQVLAIGFVVGSHHVSGRVVLYIYTIVLYLRTRNFKLNSFLHTLLHNEQVYGTSLLSLYLKSAYPPLH